MQLLENIAKKKSLCIKLHIWVHPSIDNTFFKQEVINILTMSIEPSTIPFCTQPWNKWVSSISFVDHPEDAYTIGLLPRQWMRENIWGGRDDLINLSATNMATHATYIDNDRWSGIDSWKETRLNLEEYRCYLINHEFGHLMYLKHPSENWQTLCEYNGMKYTPVMQQHTQYQFLDRIPLIYPSIYDFY